MVQRIETTLVERRTTCPPRTGSDAAEPPPVATRSSATAGRRHRRPVRAEPRHRRPGPARSRRRPARDRGPGRAGGRRARAAAQPGAARPGGRSWSTWSCRHRSGSRPRPGRRWRRSSPSLRPAVLRARSQLSEQSDPEAAAAVLDRDRAARLGRRDPQGARPPAVVEAVVARLAERGIPVVTFVTDLPTQPAGGVRRRRQPRRRGDRGVPRHAMVRRGAGQVLVTLSSASFHGEEEREAGFRAAMARAGAEPARSHEVTDTDGLDATMRGPCARPLRRPTRRSTPATRSAAATGRSSTSSTSSGRDAGGVRRPRPRRGQPAAAPQPADLGRPPPRPARGHAPRLPAAAPGARGAAGQPGQRAVAGPGGDAVQRAVDPAGPTATDSSGTPARGVVRRAPRSGRPAPSPRRARGARARPARPGSARRPAGRGRGWSGTGSPRRTRPRPPRHPGRRRGRLARSAG